MAKPEEFVDASEPRRARAEHDDPRRALCDRPGSVVKRLSDKDGAVLNPVRIAAELTEAGTVTAHASRQFEDGMMVRAGDQAAADGALGERRSLVGAKPLECDHAVARSVEKDRGPVEIEAAEATVSDLKAQTRCGDLLRFAQSRFRWNTPPGSSFPTAACN
jgi:hypothetical protein